MITIFLSLFLSKLFYFFCLKSHITIQTFCGGLADDTLCQGVLNYTIKPLVEAGVVANVYAIDAESKDGTGWAVAAACGAVVLQRATIAPELGASKGKGDAMWRALLATSPGSGENEIIAFLDGDTGDPTPAHLIGIVGPLIMNDEIQMIRGMFERPFKGNYGDVRPHGMFLIYHASIHRRARHSSRELYRFLEPLRSQSRICT